jgi:hypothetical protein
MRGLGLFAACMAGCAPEPREAFVRDVIPELERSCLSSGCHGVPAGAEAQGDVVDWSLFHVRTDDRGHVADPDGARTAALRAVITNEPPEFSSLLRKPLARVYGGTPHFGGDNWLTPDDPGYLAVRAWIELESAGGEDQPPLDALEQQFADTVLPPLRELGCLSGSCHGPDTSVPLRFEAGLNGAFSRAETRANHQAARAMLSLDGVAGQSRLVRKATPLHRGGISHKGGNTSFLTGPDDPRAAAIAAWACAERLAETGVPCASGPTLEAVVFVRGTRAPEPLFDLDVFNPGTDLHIADVGLDGRLTFSQSLSGRLHLAPADVRDPAVSSDGSTIVFAMRLAEDASFRLYLVDRASGEAVALTDPPPGTHDRDPTFGPDGLVWFVSSRAGVVDESGSNLDADLYTVDPSSGAVTRRSWTPHFERKPAAFNVGTEAGGEMSFTALRATIPGQHRAHPFRFPDGLDTEYHQHFGITPPEDLFFDLRELPDGRYVTSYGQLDAPEGPTRLAVIDRNFGPELPYGVPASTPAYLPPVVRLATERPARDPAPTADGRVLVTWGDDPADTGIAALTLTEDLRGAGPAVASVAVLLNEPGVAEFDPEPVWRRAPPRREDGWHWDEAATTGILRHQGLPMIDQLLAALPPTGTRTPRTDIVGVRLVEAIPLTPEVRRPFPDGTSTTSMTPYAPARVLCELPLAPDGTFHALVPARTAFRIQALDADGRAVGHPHNRWFDVHPGQVIPQGVSAVDPAPYGSLCAGCHGALDGDPGHAFAAPDVITTASLTLARNEGGNPRRPLPPSPCTTPTEVDFRRDIQPILDRRCGECHPAYADSAGGRWSPSYEALVPAVVPGSARSSHLFDAIDEHATLDPDERRRLVQWVDLGAGFLGATP